MFPGATAHQCQPGGANRHLGQKDKRHLLQQPQWRGNQYRGANLLLGGEWALTILNTYPIPRWVIHLGYRKRSSEQPCEGGTVFIIPFQR